MAQINLKVSGSISRSSSNSLIRIHTHSCHSHRTLGLFLVQAALETIGADLEGAVGVVAGREVEEVLQAVPLDLSKGERERDQLGRVPDLSGVNMRGMET